MAFRLWLRQTCYSTSFLHRSGTIQFQEKKAKRPVESLLKVQSHIQVELETSEHGHVPAIHQSSFPSKRSFLIVANFERLRNTIISGLDNSLKLDLPFKV